MKLPRPGSILLALILISSVAALLLYETGHLPYRVYVVHTGSMYPTIPSESAVVVREDRYRVGEVVSFTENGEVVSHRLMAIKPDGTIVTKGDANRTIDPWHVPASNIIGGVVAAPRHLGYLLTYVKTPEGGASILIAFLCLWQIWALAGEIGQAEASEGALNAGVAKVRRRPGGRAHGWPDKPPFLAHWRR
jgi:signal peptidase